MFSKVRSTGPVYAPAKQLETLVRTNTVCANLDPWVPGSQVPSPQSLDPWSSSHVELHSHNCLDHYSTCRGELKSVDTRNLVSMKGQTKNSINKVLYHRDLLSQSHGEKTAWCLLLTHTPASLGRCDLLHMSTHAVTYCLQLECTEKWSASKSYTVQI